MEKDLGEMVKTKKINKDTESWSSGRESEKQELIYRQINGPRDKMVALLEIEKRMKRHLQGW